MSSTNLSETSSGSVLGKHIDLDAQVIPDGGFRAWLVVFGAWCGLFCSLGWLNSIGTFQSYYQTTLLKGLPASTISWIPSLEIFFTFVMSPIIGCLYDHFGQRWVMLGGTFMHVLGLTMASLASDFPQILLAQGVCSALGICAVFQPCMASIPSWFKKRRGLAYGIVSSGTSLGGVVFPIMVSRLISSVGFAWSMRISGFLILSLLIISNMTVKPKTPPQAIPMTKALIARPFNEKSMVLLLTGFFFLTFGVFIPMNYIVIQAIDDGMNADLASYLPSLLNAASLLGRLSAGCASDLLGPFNVVAIACYIAGTLSLALWIPVSTHAGLFAFSVLFGFFSGAYIALAASMVVQLSPFQEIGYRTGLLFLAASISGLTASPIGGALLARDGGSYVGMQIFSGLTLIVGSSFVLGARLTNTGLSLFTKF